MSTTTWSGWPVQRGSAASTATRSSGPPYSNPRPYSRIIRVVVIGRDFPPAPLARTRASAAPLRRGRPPPADRKSTRLNSSHSQISYAVFCLKKKKKEKKRKEQLQNTL